MTTTTTGTPSPQARNIILAIAALGLVAFLALNQGISTNSVTSQQTAETEGVEASLPDSVAGFDYDHEATTGRIAGTPVTGEYFGNSGELYPEGHALDQPMVDPLAAVTADPAIAEFFGLELPSSPAVSAETADRAVAEFEGTDLPEGYAVRPVQPVPAVAPVRSETPVRAVAPFAGTDLPEGYAVGPVQPVLAVAPVGSETPVRAVAPFAGIDLPEGYAVGPALTALDTGPSLPESVTGFEYDHEASTGRWASAGVTSSYFGFNPELDAEK